MEKKVFKHVELCETEKNYISILSGVYAFLREAKNVVVENGIDDCNEIGEAVVNIANRVKNTIGEQIEEDTANVGRMLSDYMFARKKLSLLSNLADAEEINADLFRSFVDCSLFGIEGTEAITNSYDETEADYLRILDMILKASENKI